MNEYITVGLTLRNPLFTRSLLMSSAFGVLTGTWREYRNWLMMGLWFTKFQMYLSKDPNSSMTCIITRRSEWLQFEDHGWIKQSSTMLHQPKTFLAIDYEWESWEMQNHTTDVQYEQNKQWMNKKVHVYTFRIWRAFSTIDRSFTSDNKELAGLPGKPILLSFNLETAIGSKSKKTSLFADKCHWSLNICNPHYISYWIPVQQAHLPFITDTFLNCE